MQPVVSVIANWELYWHPTDLSRGEERESRASKDMWKTRNDKVGKIVMKKEIHGDGFSPELGNFKK